MTKILVIEDENPYRENILELLQAEDFEAIGAENGYLGLQLAESETPDLILCDVMMPQLDGYGVIEALRKNPVTATIPFIFLTAKVDKSDFRTGMELGADDYITKPFTCDELLRAIAARLQRQKSIIQPLTEALKQTTERLNHLLHYDSTTNLPNRLLLREQFAQIITKRQEVLREAGVVIEAPTPVPILLLGIDRFNRIFDSLGTQTSELLIKQVAMRITTALGSDDAVARLSPDQFAIVLATVHQRQTVASIAQTILLSLSEPFRPDSEQIFLTASVGITFYPTNGIELDSLMKKASSAMFYLQKLGGNHYQFYTAELETSCSESLAMEASLHRALDQGEFQVYYQPIVNLQTNKIIGAEALVRWKPPRAEMISPAKFIPLAEETGLIVPLGEQVLRSACTQAKKWINAGYGEFQISVNLSARQFSQRNLSQRIADILNFTDLHPTALQLELTESALAENAEAAISTLNELKQLGIQIAIDDFGTGYATLSYLKQFPFDPLKIDQCFVRDVASSAQNTAIMTAVIQLAHNLNLKVTAEGVENEADLAYLKQQSCDAMQGYLFSRPLPATEFEKLLCGEQR